MSESPSHPVTLIGDVVQSRSHADRSRLQEQVLQGSQLVNGWVRPLQPVHPTLGDEFQGVYANLGDAAMASMLLRLQLLRSEMSIESRYGLGIGEFEVFSEDAQLISQDGPGWWAARQAIEHVHELEAKTRNAAPHTWVSQFGLPETQPMVDIANAFFLTRDALIDRMTDRQRRPLIGLLLGRSQPELAAQDGISQSAVSQTLKASGAYSLVAAQYALSGVDQ